MKQIIFSCLFLLCGLTTQVMASSPLDETPEAMFLSSAAAQLREKAASSSPVELFEYIRNYYEYVPYHGSRSGAINTYLSGRGNDVDLASTLIALYRAKGIPARYVVADITVPQDELKNWIGVKNGKLAAYILAAQGIPNVTFDVKFEHVWVEVQLPYSNYRGIGLSAENIDCQSQPSMCSWISLDPSHKFKTYNENALDIHDILDFDYDAYFNAIKDDSVELRGKNPLEIYEDQIFDYLQQNYPGQGKTLNDVAYTGEIQENFLGLLPASLPYKIAGNIRRYNSVAEHDIAESSNPWEKRLTMTVRKQVVGSNGTAKPDSSRAIIDQARFLLSDLATQKLTLAFEDCGTDCLGLRLRLDGQLKVSEDVKSPDYPVDYLNFGDAFTVDFSMDGATSSITAQYLGQVAGGYFLVVTGGDESNWSQAQRAVDALMVANSQYPIENDNGTPFIDTNGNGVLDSSELLLKDNPEAMEAHTGNLLWVAAQTYHAQLYEDLRRLDSLNHVHTSIDGLMGMVSSLDRVDYVDGTAFSVTPAGLLIDLKGNRTNGNYRINQERTTSHEHFRLVGHIQSSLEHEVWQKLTGFDAVSTVRGIQKVLGQGGQLLDFSSETPNDLVNHYSDLGFSLSIPQSYTTFPLDNYNFGGFLSENDEIWEVFQSQVSASTPELQKKSALFSTEYTSELSCLIQSIPNWQNTVNQNGPQAIGTFNGPICNLITVTSYPATIYLTEVINAARTTYQEIVALNYFEYFNINSGFNPNTQVYRLRPEAGSSLHSSNLIAGIRNNLFTPNGYRNDYQLPNQLSKGDTGNFSVYILDSEKLNDGDDTSITFAISQSGAAAGGGYVDSSSLLTPSFQTVKVFKI